MNTNTRIDDVAWVAGVGEGAGLGAAVARRYAAGGLTVAVTGRSLDRIEAVAKSIRDAGGRAAAVQADLGNEADMRIAAVKVAALGRLRAGVFNAAGWARGGLLDLNAAQFEEAWRGSALAAFLFSQQVVQALKTGSGNGASGDTSAQALGSLIFTGATASLRGGARFAGFASSKAALRSLAQSIAREFGPEGIHVAHVIIDGGIDGARLRGSAPQRVADAGTDGLLDPDQIAETYWQLHRQHRSAWTFELDLRPYKENF